MNLQPTLENENLILIPLQETDFEELFAVAADPLVWEQHPNKERYKREVFSVYFDGAIESKGAFMIKNKLTNETMGSTRFYDYKPENKSVLIGYTFYGRAFWGSGFNPPVKKLLLDYAFQFVDVVYFQVGAANIRSQKAMEKLGGIKHKEIEVAYFGEPEKLNFEYKIERKDWLNLV